MQKSTFVLSSQDPKSSIVTFRDNKNNSYYYSYCQKQGQTFSIISHKRMLIYNEQNYTLYYTHQPQNKSQLQSLITNPKKTVTDISLAVVRSEPKSKILSVMFNKKGNGNEVAGAEWKFIMDIQGLAQEWQEFLKVKKQEKTAKMLNIDKNDAKMVNDVLSFGFSRNDKETAPQKKQQPNNTNTSKLNEPTNPPQTTSKYNNRTSILGDDPLYDPQTNGNTNNISNNNNSYNPRRTETSNPMTQSVTKPFNPTQSQYRPISTTKQPQKEPYKQPSRDPTKSNVNTNSNLQYKNPNQLQVQKNNNLDPRDTYNQSEGMNKTSNDKILISGNINRQSNPESTYPNKNNPPPPPTTINNKQPANSTSQSKLQPNPSKTNNEGNLYKSALNEKSPSFGRQSDMNKQAGQSRDNPNANTSAGRNTYANNPNTGSNLTPTKPINKSEYRNQNNPSDTNPRNSTNINNTNNSNNTNTNPTNTNNTNTNKPSNYGNKSSYKPANTGDNPQSSNLASKYSNNPANSNNSEVSRNNNNSSMRNQNKRQPRREQDQNDPNTNKNESNQDTDWNKRFIQHHNQKTIKEFSDHALQQFLKLPPQNIMLRGQTQSKDEQLQPYTVIRNNISFSMAEIGTKAGNKLKRQFNNYHFILESCKQNKFINVPLACLIKYLGIVCLAKAQFPASAQVITTLGANNQVALSIVKQLRTLQMYTKVSTEQIKKSATILNLSKQYGQQQNMKRIYIQNLLDYLPNSRDSPYPFDQQIRPQLILDNISRTINPKSPQILQQLATITNRRVKELSDAISQNQIVITNYADFKEILRSYGLNEKVIPDLYNNVRSRFAKRYIHTIMLCVILKYQIQRSITDFRETSQLEHIQSVIQQALRIYLEPAPTQRIYDEIWSSVSQQFKRKYRVSLNFKQLEAGFMLSTLMSMINAQYDLTKLDKTRRLFQQISIIYRGFVVKLKPVVKMYHRFTTQKVESVMNFCRKQSNHIPQIQKIMPLSNPSQLQFLLLQKRTPKFLSYLSRYISPFNPTHQKLHTIIYEHLNRQPPTLMSHIITLNYARHCQNPRTNKIDQYKKVIEKAADIISYWLGEDHPLLCDIYQSLSDYYGGVRNYEDSINFMKQALTTCIRATGMHNEKVGTQYFKLAEKQWKYGEKKDALENYNKAKANMQSLNEVNPQYPVLLTRVASLELNSGNPDRCILSAIKAIKANQQKPLPDSQLIKIYQILCRAYQLNQNKEQLKNLALLTAKVFNNTNSQQTFEKMMRICLVGFSVNLIPGKQQKVLQYVRTIQKSLKFNGGTSNSKDAIQKLIKISNDIVSMEKFYKGMESIEKLITEVKYGRNQSNQGRQFRILLQLILEAVGLDFFQGTINNAKYW